MARTVTRTQTRHTTNFDVLVHPYGKPDHGMIFAVEARSRRIAIKKAKLKAQGWGKYRWVTEDAFRSPRFSPFR